MGNRNKNIVIALFVAMLCAPMHLGSAQLQDLRAVDTDMDGLTDYDEAYVYHTSLLSPDSDGDGYADKSEVDYGYDPNKNGDDKLEKVIRINIAEQTLVYFLGPYLIGSFQVSTGRKGYETPKGEFAINVKHPVVRYSGPGYDYPNTKWNMRFTRVPAGGIYIHGAYWHNKFGTPFSHGCVNVAYANMEPLYKWAEVGTKVVVE